MPFFPVVAKNMLLIINFLAQKSRPQEKSTQHSHVNGSNTAKLTWTSTRADQHTLLSHKSHQHQHCTLHCIRDIFLDLYVCAVGHFGGGGRAVQYLRILLGLTDHCGQLVYRSTRQSWSRHGDWWHHAGTWPDDIWMSCFTLKRMQLHLILHTDSSLTQTAKHLQLKYYKMLSCNSRDSVSTKHEKYCHLTCCC